MVSVEPDREYYEGVGRVVMVAAFWELALASVVAAADPDSDIWTVASQPGRPLKDLRRLGSQLSKGGLGAEIRWLVAEAEVVLAERHRITHSVLAISYLGPGRSERVLMNANPRSRPDFATELGRV